VLGWVIWTWAQGGFGRLEMLREMTLGSTLCMLGLQTFFGGFLLSVVGGNDPELQVVFERKDAAPPTLVASIPPPPLN
jgi:hypothetical protein